MSKEKMHTILWFMALTIGLLGTFFIGYTRTESLGEIQQGIAEEVFRFHVRANSDSEEDQRVKMLVKEQVVDYLQAVLQDAESADETKKKMREQLSEIEAQAETILKQENCDYKVHAKVGTSDFPEKVYGDCRFPAGSYDALILELGTGQGHNWWCMLYPGLCFLNESYGIVTTDKKAELENVLTDTEFSWITDWDKVHISFKWF